MTTDLDRRAGEFFFDQIRKADPYQGVRPVRDPNLERRLSQALLAGCFTGTFPVDGLEAELFCAGGLGLRAYTSDRLSDGDFYTRVEEVLTIDEIVRAGAAATLLPMVESWIAAMLEQPDQPAYTTDRVRLDRYGRWDMLLKALRELTA